MLVLASVLLLIGLLGIVVPILPGLPFLVAAALLFTANSPGLRRRLLQSLRSRTSFRRVHDLFAARAAEPGRQGDDEMDGLTASERLKLRALRGARTVLPKSKR